MAATALAAEPASAGRRAQPARPRAAVGSSSRPPAWAPASRRGRGRWLLRPSGAWRFGAASGSAPRAAGAWPRSWSADPRGPGCGPPAPCASRADRARPRCPPAAARRCAPAGSAARDRWPRQVQRPRATSWARIARSRVSNARVSAPDTRVLEQILGELADRLFALLVTRPRKLFSSLMGATLLVAGPVPSVPAVRPGAALRAPGRSPPPAGHPSSPAGHLPQPQLRVSFV